MCETEMSCSGVTASPVAVGEGNTARAGALASAAAANHAPHAVLRLQIAVKWCSPMFCGVNTDCYLHGCCQGEALKLVWHKQGEPGMPVALLGHSCHQELQCSSCPKGLVLLLQPFL